MTLGVRARRQPPGSGLEAALSPGLGGGSSRPAEGLPSDKQCGHRPGQTVGGWGQALSFRFQGMKSKHGAANNLPCWQRNKSLGSFQTRAWSGYTQGTHINAHIFLSTAYPAKQPHPQHKLPQKPRANETQTEVLSLTAAWSAAWWGEGSWAGVRRRSVMRCLWGAFLTAWWENGESRGEGTVLPAPGRARATLRADVAAAFSVGDCGAGLWRRWGQWEAKAGSPLPMERRSVLPVVKRKHYKVPVYVLK